MIGVLMKSLLIAASALMLFPTIGLASDWVDVQIFEGKAVLLDADSIKYSNKKKTQRQAWVKFLMLDNSSFPAGDYILILNHFNCSSGAVKPMETLYFSRDGELKLKTDQSHRGWSISPPDSLPTYLSQITCSYPYLD